MEETKPKHQAQDCRRRAWPEAGHGASDKNRGGEEQEGRLSREGGREEQSHTERHRDAADR